MIGIETSRSGHPVLVHDGRFLSSSVDPIREAQAWAAKAAVKLADFSAMAILGLGSGYHVRQLLDLCPNKPFVVIEREAEVAAKVSELSPDLLFDRLALEPDWRRLLEHPPVREVLEKPFCVLKYAPSCQMNPEYYTKVEKLLLGRDKTSFLIQLRMRGELFSLLDPDRLKALDSEIVSIKTLQKLFKADTLSTERMVWKILEELVV